MTFSATSACIFGKGLNTKFLRIRSNYMKPDWSHKTRIVQVFDRR